MKINELNKNTNFFLKALLVDLDGCLADFDKKVQEITGFSTKAQPSKSKMWKALANSKDFYYSLDFMPDAPSLWKYIAPYKPIILSGVPMGKWAYGQKKRWVGEKLGWDVPVVLGMARDKPENAMKFLNVADLEGCILIDDRLDAQAPWEAAGGTFIHHTSAANTIHQLKGLGL